MAKKNGGLADMAIQFGVVAMVVALLAVILAAFRATPTVAANVNATDAIDAGFEITDMFGDWTPLLVLIALAVIGIAYMKRAG